MIFLWISISSRALQWTCTEHFTSLHPELPAIFPCLNDFLPISLRWELAGYALLCIGFKALVVRPQLCMLQRWLRSRLLQLVVPVQNQSLLRCCDVPPAQKAPLDCVDGGFPQQNRLPMGDLQPLVVAPKGVMDPDQSFNRRVCSLTHKQKSAATGINCRGMHKII